MPLDTQTRSWRCSPGLFRAALDALREAGGDVVGGDAEGRVGANTPAGRLEGRYTFDGDIFTIVVTRRPALVPIEMIWSRIERLCGPPVASA